MKVTLVDGESFFLNNARPGPGHDLVILYPYPPGMTTDLPTGEDGYPVMPRVLIVVAGLGGEDRADGRAAAASARRASGYRAVAGAASRRPGAAAGSPRAGSHGRAAASVPRARRLRLDFRRFCPVYPADQQGGGAGT